MATECAILQDIVVVLVSADTYSDQSKACIVAGNIEQYYRQLTCFFGESSFAMFGFHSQEHANKFVEVLTND